ncbi:MAG TPA: cysteine desulfurase [Candidatus Hydrogenedens sp.]|nr:cysteine desulfurase [Candidatus Hydrogenedens sp.]
MSLAKEKTQKSLRLRAEILARRLGLESIRSQFPILETMVHGKPLIYLDNAATTQKPQNVIDTITRYYLKENANVHRGIHYLSEKITDKYEEVRSKVARFINAKVDCEIVFTKGTTESINLIAQSYARPRLMPDDEILITEMEHHSNMIPWQVVSRQTGAKLKYIPITEEGYLDLSRLDELLTSKTKIVSVTHVSNVLGTINPIREIAQKAHDVGAVFIVDGAQSIAHMPIDVQDLGCDFFACSAHKFYGPTGIGILYGRAPLLERMEPYQTGGSMILNVTLENTIYAHSPQKFEAGTPNIEGVIGLGSAIDFLQSIGMQKIFDYEEVLIQYAMRTIDEIPGVRILGPKEHHTGVISFIMDSAHPHDIGQILDEEGIAIRAGHHCAQPIMERYGVSSTARASFAVYNVIDEIDALIKAIYKIKEIFE